MTIEDPLVTEYVDAAVEPYRGRMPAADLEVFRVRLCLYYETSPDAVELLDEIRRLRQEAPVVSESGERPRRGASALAEAAERKRSAG